jgi:hypothetical protein
MPPIEDYENLAEEINRFVKWLLINN